jgi:beta,beta-carotene 9',10'-dioxygenase
MSQLGTETSQNFSLGFKTLESEISVDRLEVKGQIPVWLKGSLIRTGPAKFEQGEQSYNHWFDGMAMLHSFKFNVGAAGYKNKFIQSTSYLEGKQQGKILYQEFASDPHTSLFKKLFSIFIPPPKIVPNANVNIARIAGEYIAMTETPLPVAFNPETLETCGVFNYEDHQKGMVTTAHPHFDNKTGDTYNCLIHFSNTSTFNFYRIRPNSKKRELITAIPVKNPPYVHSFAMTENYLIFIECPFIVNPLKLFFKLKPFIENYQWHPERGATFYVVEKSSGNLKGTYKTGAFFCFHNINAFEKDGEIILDLIAFPDASIVMNLKLDAVRNNPPVIPGEFRRYSIPLTGKKAEFEKITDAFLEFPRINYAKNNSKDYYFAYCLGSTSKEGYFNRLFKINVKEKNYLSWSEENCYPGEPVFVPSPGSVNEDDGVILSVVLNGNKENSFLLIIDACSFKEIGRAEVPHHIPYGFHGQYFRD